MTLFAEAGTRQDVENALGTARDQLRVTPDQRRTAASRCEEEHWGSVMRD